MTIPDSKLKANRVPTLAIIGSIDPLKTGVDELNGRMANLHTVVIDGADHMTAFSRPEFVANVQKFLSQAAVDGKAKRSQAVPAGAGR